MSDLGRREFLAGGAAGVGVLLPSGALAGRGVDRVGRSLRRIERVRSRIGVRVAPARELLPTPEGGAPDAAFVDHMASAAVAAMVYAEAGRLSIDEQADPRMQDELWAAAEDMGRSVRVVSDRFDALGEQRWQELDAVVEREDAALTALAAAIEAEIEELDLPRQTRAQLSRTVREQHFEVRQRGLKATMRRLLSRTRKVQRMVAGHADPMDAVRAATPAGAVSPSLQGRADAGVGRVDGGELVPTPGDDDEGKKGSPGSSSGDAAMGALLLGLGLAGTVLLFVSGISSGGFTLLCVCVSIPLLLGSVICLAAGAALVSEGG